MHYTYRQLTAYSMIVVSVRWVCAVLIVHSILLKNLLDEASPSLARPLGQLLFYQKRAMDANINTGMD